MFRFFDAANAVTLLGLSSSIGSMLCAATGRLRYAIVFLIAAGLCDFLDGAVARAMKRTDEQRAFGGNLDSIVDACSFAMAPVILLYAVGLRSPAEVALILAFAIAGVWRLAYFDTTGIQTEGDRRYYTGLPITYVALVLPLTLLTLYAGPDQARIAGNVAAAVLAVAMVAPVRIPKPRGAAYIIFPMLALGVGGFYLAVTP
jgi:CDP-diacylglycerol--serine O-phosphatidyltransferase